MTILRAALLGSWVLLGATGRVARADHAMAPLGVTYSGWRGGFLAAEERIRIIQSTGFKLVSIVPAFAYGGRNQIDIATGPTMDELGRGVAAALHAGLQVVVKPHLDPLAFSPGYDRLASDNHSWRAAAPWRGFFDLDPLCADYREGVVLAILHMLNGVLAEADREGVVGRTKPAPVRVELGVELMNSIVEFPERWERLAVLARQELRKLGLTGRVLLSHNFSHHIEIPDDEVNRMDLRRRQALGRYIRQLDAIALSQYMDLTVAVPLAERGQRLPTPSEVATALTMHERHFFQEVLQGLLGLSARDIPPFHIGEFGIGRGGLRHPNTYGGTVTPRQATLLAREIAVGHQGLIEYLRLPAGRDGRAASSAVLWVTGAYYDVFGWGNPAYGTPAAADAIRTALTVSPVSP